LLYFILYIDSQGR